MRDGRGRRAGRRAHRGQGGHPSGSHGQGERLPLWFAAGSDRRDVAAASTRSSHSPSSREPIDRQVKFYSSGMQMRLGFAVAAFLEPDVLLVDEVLAVGDASFQQRCLDRMRVVLAQGTTLVFVSTISPLWRRRAPAASGCTRRHRGGRADARGPVCYRRSIEESAELMPQDRRPGQASEGRGYRPRWWHAAKSRSSRHLAHHREPEARSASVCLGVSEGPATPIFLVRRDLHSGGGKQGHLFDTQPASPAWPVLRLGGRVRHR